MSVIVSIYHDRRNLRKKTQDYPIKLRVYASNQGPRLYPTVYALSQQDYDKHTAPNVGGALRKVRENLKTLIKTAEETVASYDSFSFDDFERQFLMDNPHIEQVSLKLQPIANHKKEFDFEPYLTRFPIIEETFDPGTIGEIFQLIIKEKIERKKPLSTSALYQCTYVSLKKFSGNVSFKEVTSRFIALYTEWMIDTPQPKGKKLVKRTKTTVGMYLRNLRHAYKIAIKHNRIKEKSYPFKDDDVIIPSSNNTKKALELEEIAALYNYECDPEMPWLKKAKAFWFFMYFGNGMNPLDILNLKYKDIKVDMLEFERGKTENTLAKDPPKITIVLNEDLLNTIEEYGNPDKSPENYVFPYFTESMTVLRRYEVKLLFIEFINKHIRYIANVVKIAKDVSCGFARGSYATSRRMDGADILDMQDELGHIDPKTTRRYVNSLPWEIRKKSASHLYKFKQVQKTA